MNMADQGEKSRADDSDQNERQRISMLLGYEKSLWDSGLTDVAGADEVGRGPLAGPVVAAVVIFPQDVFIAGINDSKKLTAKRREELFNKIYENSRQFGVGIVHNTEIDRINILKATHLAVRKALGRLSVQPQHVLIDGKGLPEITISQTAIIEGDRKCFSIAAASIFAKVVRDRLMIAYDRIFPDYGFARHKGYGTRRHVEAIQKYGPCPIHRRSFKIKRLLDKKK
jgi:ribonuclease HII